MALPDDFSPWDHLHQMLLGAYNQQVEKTFVGVPVDDLENTQSAMKLACLLQADDTVDMTVLRLLLYYFVFKGNLPQPIYGLPATEFHATKQFLPQVVLWFKEKSITAKENNRYPVRARVSYRIINPEFIQSTSLAHELAIQIKELFVGFSFEKGTIKVSYRDIKNGFEFILAVNSENDAKNVIEKVLELSSQVPNWQHLTNSESGENFQEPPMVEILGKEYKLPVRRPTAQVFFTHAELKIYGMPKDVILVDTTNKFPGAYQVA